MRQTVCWEMFYQRAQIVVAYAQTPGDVLILHGLYLMAARVL
jgi:hypothetical protein